MAPHFSLNVFLEVIAIWTNTDHLNSRMYRIAIVRVLQFMQAVPLSTLLPTMDTHPPKVVTKHTSTTALGCSVPTTIPSLSSSANIL